MQRSVDLRHIEHKYSSSLIVKKITNIYEKVNKGLISNLKVSTEVIGCYFLDFAIKTIATILYCNKQVN